MTRTPRPHPVAGTRLARPGDAWELTRWTVAGYKHGARHGSRHERIIAGYFLIMVITTFPLMAAAKALLIASPARTYFVSDDRTGLLR